jgi:hypothetical protein
MKGGRERKSTEGGGMEGRMERSVEEREEGKEEY